MPARSLSSLAAISWLTLLLGAGALFIFAHQTPEVALLKSTNQRDEELRSIQAETDVYRLQQLATMHISASYATGTTATALCRLAQVTLLIVVAGSVVSLVQVRRIKSGFRTLPPGDGTPNRMSAKTLNTEH